MLLASALLSWALTGLLVRLLSTDRHRAVPNHRSMHKAPTPVGGGLAIIASVLVMALAGTATLPKAVTIILSCASALSLISALDHYRTVWPLTRLAAQALAVAIGLSLLPESLRLLPQIPVWLEHVAIALAWLWLINLNNFMDGIDGIAASQGAAVAIGFVAVIVWGLGDGATALRAGDVTLALALAGSCLGYLVWNWHPARIFMGDAGSIPLGFLLGWLLLVLAAEGAMAAALVLPILFAADASVTLVRRLMAGAKPWHAHRTHFYQRAVQGGASPPHVVGLLSLCNLVLIMLALQPLTRPVAVIAAGLGVAVVFLAVLSHWASIPTESAPEV